MFDPMKGIELVGAFGFLLLPHGYKYINIKRLVSHYV
jgi:hypothetical protein